MLKNNLKISIVIPTRNRLTTLCETLESISKSEYLPYEIIIVDQSDTPIDNEEVHRCLDPGIMMKLIYADIPSLTRARNTGAANTTGDIILFMDDDILLNEQSLEELANTFLNDRVAFVNAPDSSIASAKSKYPDLLGLFFLRKKLSAKRAYVCKGAVLGRFPKNIDNTSPVDWGMGFFFAVRKELFDKYKIKFDEKLISYAYPEDLDFTWAFCKKAWEDGGICLINPKIYVNHLATQEWRIPNQKATFMYVINRVYISYKHLKNPINRLVLIWSDVGEILRRFIIKQDFKTIIRAYMLCFKYRHELRDGEINENLYKYMR